MNSARRTLAAGVAGALVLVGCVTPASWAGDDSTPAPAPDAPQATVRVVPGADLHAAAVERLASMSTLEKAASIVMGHIPTTDAAVLSEYMSSTGIGGFILMGANIPATESDLRGITAALTIDPALPPLIAVDQEGGDVSRLPWDRFPSSVTLKDQPAAATRDAFAARAALLQRAGIGVNFGVVADVTPDRSMFIYRRALGTTPASGAERVIAAVDGEGGAAMSTLKHFPGHGAAPGDSHSGIPSTGMSKTQWEAGDGIPFRAGIDAGAPFLMFGHLSYGAVDPAPATLSAEWHRVAREELGFTGVAITDDLGMLQATGLPGYQDPVANAVAAVAAGNDMVLGIVFTTADSAPRTAEGIAAAVDGGMLPQGRLDEAAVRVMTARLDLAAQGRGLVPCADCAPVG
ncbi:beta-N-acetylhexosaminidase [Microbacterium sp. cf046]|uniref:glycoside hydrolase family 3 N-terminal domain-containing protein n=1 Tax=Microbacterium sp. cf046 TaxID=1761803 RepID=UPI0008F004B2|nr:glycoside hydrolase family 3 N-terminal domain-containing protein [Microbacterium sp. cf046]SFS05644.1 beta-N-acetylhexosaminidase [Microbacterium sp. cf046]